MKLEIQEKEKNPLTGRTEIRAVALEINATPSQQEVHQALAEKLSAHKEQIVIKKIAQGFGENKAKITAYLYDDEGSLKKFEREKKKKKERQEAKPEAKKEKQKEEKSEKKEEKPEIKEEKNYEKKDSKQE